MIKETNRREESVINSCIIRSKDIALLQAAKISNRHTKFFTLRTLRSLRSQGSITDIEEDLNQLIDDHKLSIARLLKPQFLANNIPFRVQRNGMNLFWFSSYDLANGYVILNKLVLKDTATHVLFLSDLESNPFFEGSIKAGEIHPYDKVAHLLEDIQPAWNDKRVIGKLHKQIESCEKV